MEMSKWQKTILTIYKKNLSKESAKHTSWNLADVGNLLTLINEKYSFSIIISIFIVINSVKQVTNTSHPLNILLHYLQVARLEVADTNGVLKARHTSLQGWSL